VTLFFLWLSACTSCGGQPDSIPSEAGKLTEEIAPDLLTASSPDLVVVPWAALAQLALEDYRDCPLVYLTDSQIYIDAGGADGCLDSAGYRWQGTASATFASSSIALEFNDFGPVAGVPSPWTALGSLQLTPTGSGSGQKVTSRLAVTSYGPGDTLDFWNESTGGFAFYGGTYYVDHLNGTVGIGDWGTAEVDVNRVPLSLVNGCTYGEHAAGNIALFAQNDGYFTFQAADVAAAPTGPPPPPAAGDTANTGDTGDTAGGGGGGGSGSTNVIPNPTGAAGELCGECAQLAIDGEPLAGCVAATRVMSWPFIAPF